MTCLYCDKAPVAHHRCQVHLDVYLRMQRAFPFDQREARRERRWEARVSR